MWYACVIATVLTQSRVTLCFACRHRQSAQLGEFYDTNVLHLGQAQQSNFFFSVVMERVMITYHAFAFKAHCSERRKMIWYRQMFWNHNWWKYVSKIGFNTSSLYQKNAKYQRQTNSFYFGDETTFLPDINHLTYLCCSLIFLSKNTPGLKLH